MLEEARQVVEALPPEDSGRCVLTPEGTLVTDGWRELVDRLARNEVRFHEGRIRGAVPRAVR